MSGRYVIHPMFSIYSFLTILDAPATETTNDLTISTYSFPTAQELPNNDDHPASKKVKLDSRSSTPLSTQKIKQCSCSRTSTPTSAWKTKQDWLSPSYPNLYPSRGLHGWRWCKCYFFCYSLTIEALHHWSLLHYKYSCIHYVEEKHSSTILLLCIEKLRASYLLRRWQADE